MVIENMISGGLHYIDGDYEKYSWTLGPCSLDVYEPCTSGKILFYLYTRKTKDNPIPLKVTDKGPPINYDSRASTKVVIHGYAGNADFNGTALVRRAYLEKGDFNIIVVDWGQLVKLPCYPTAVLNTWQAGRCTAQLLANLSKMGLRGYGIDRLHAIGFSLGAHVAAYASNELRLLVGKQFARITGLDPALPFFASLKNSWKLNKDDANFVDIIHTNCGVFGKIEASGHVDFYVNGGFSQPSCSSLPNVPLCSHLMATVYFAESISGETRGFFGSPCPSYFQYAMGWCKKTSQTTAKNRVLMGDGCRPRSRGVYFVETRSRPPYALG